MKGFINALLNGQDMDYIANNFNTFEIDELKEIILECLFLMDDSQLDELTKHLIEVF